MGRAIGREDPVGALDSPDFTVQREHHTVYGATQHGLLSG